MTDALGALAEQEAMYAYNFKGKRYDVGNKMGYLEATIEFALKREDLRGPFKAYIENIIKSDLFINGK